MALRDKANELLRVAQSIEDEDFWSDVTMDEQLLLQEVVRAIRASGNLLMLHVKVVERSEAAVESLLSFNFVKTGRTRSDKPNNSTQKRKLRVVK